MDDDMEIEPQMKYKGMTPLYVRKLQKQKVSMVEVRFSAF